MLTPQDRRKEPKGIVGAWNYACPCNRPQMPFDVGPVLLTSVPHQYRRTRFLTVPEHFEG